MYKKLGLMGAFFVGVLVANDSFANINCGIPPIPPVGCAPICICDSAGCYYIYTCDEDE